MSICVSCLTSHMGCFTHTCCKSTLTSHYGQNRLASSTWLSFVRWRNSLVMEFSSVPVLYTADAPPYCCALMPHARIFPVTHISEITVQSPPQAYHPCAIPNSHHCDGHSFRGQVKKGITKF